MRVPEVDGRSKEEIIQYIKKYLTSYTPEWRFDETNPDVGTALAMIYADVMSDTVDRLNRVSGKNKISFLNRIGAGILPAAPASGFVSFGLVNNEVKGVEVVKGTKLIADNADGESIYFETLNDVFVTPSSPDCVFMCNREEDLISGVHDEELLPKDADKHEIGKLMFDFHKENLQEHELYFSHPILFDVENDTWIFINFSGSTFEKLSDEMITKFMDSNNVRFEYYTEDGFKPFSEQQILYGQIALRRKRTEKKFAPYLFTDCDVDKKAVKQGLYIRCVIKDIKPFLGFKVSKMGLCTSSERINLEAANCKGVDENPRRFFPFGEKPSLYDEAYLVSEEVFSKKGAEIKLEFDLEFKEIKSDIEVPDPEMNWKPVMKKSDIKPIVEYDIDVAEILWEYFNGEGFVRLPIEAKFSKIFESDGKVVSGQAKHMEISFRCPEDIDSFSVGSVNAHCLRMRVLKMNNLYKLKTKYISPIIGNPKLSYNYYGSYVTPETVIVKNNMEVELFNNYGIKVNNEDFAPFVGRDEESTSIYIGFKVPPIGAPIKMMFSFDETMYVDMPSLGFEYLTKKRWAPLNLVDGTENFRKTGVVTIVGNKDFEKKKLFGKERYWIRVVDINNDYYKKKESIKLPHLQRITMNVTDCLGVESVLPETFFIHQNQENKVVQLQNKRVYDISVWVNEIKNIKEKEIEELEKTGDVQVIKSVSGEPEEIWVKWQEVSDFSFNGPDRRCFVCDRVNGRVLFGDGINGRIPTAGDLPTIKVIYRCGGGEETNLPAGAISKLDRSIGYINSVQNIDVTRGGVGEESVEAAIERHSAILRHGYRAVTEKDYEDLAVMAVRNIEKAKCFSNRNTNGELSYGHVALVILQQDYENGHKYFDALRNKVLDFLKDKVASYLYEQNRIHVIEPDFIAISAIVSVQVSDYNQIFEVKHLISEKLKAFLDPISGNFSKSGWDIGEIPNSNQVLNSLKEISGIHYIESVRLTAKRSNGDEVDIEGLQNMMYMLPLSGEHDIRVTVREK